MFTSGIKRGAKMTKDKLLNKECSPENHVFEMIKFNPDTGKLVYKCKYCPKVLEY